MAWLDFLILITKIPGLTAQRYCFLSYQRGVIAFHPPSSQNADGIYLWVLFEFKTRLFSKRCYLVDSLIPRPAGRHTIRSIVWRFNVADDTTIDLFGLTARQHWVLASSWAFEGFDGFQTSRVSGARLLSYFGRAPDWRATPGHGIDGSMAASWLSWDAALDHNSILG